MKRFLALILTVVMFSTLAVGCTPAKKPTPTPTPAPNAAPRVTPTPNAAPRVTPAPAKKPAVNKMPTTPADVNKLADRLAGEAVKVKGVRKAAVALSNTTAYVGIDLDPNVQAQQTNAIKKEVANRVKKADKRLNNVYVTSDVGVVTRIKNVATGIGQGKPISSFATELAEIGRRIKPQSRK